MSEKTKEYAPKTWKVVTSKFPGERDHLEVVEANDSDLTVCTFYSTGWQNLRAATLCAAAPDLLRVIKAALRIERLWLPPADSNAQEHSEELAALEIMRKQFNEAVLKASVSI